MLRESVQLLLWEVIEPVRRRLREIVQPHPKPPAIQRPPSPSKPATVRRKRPAEQSITATQASPTMQARYDAVVREMLGQYKVRVRRWRKNMSGIAWYVTYRDGSVVRLIESPKPKGPMSMAIFLHEIGHHAIGFNVYKPRCLEEYHAWMFAIREMERLNLNITDAVRTRMRKSLAYAVAKARRRGIKTLPAELIEYAT